LSRHSQIRQYLLDLLHESPVFSSAILVFIQTPDSYIKCQSPPNKGNSLNKTGLIYERSYLSPFLI